MKKLILFLFLLPFFASAQIQMSQVSGLIPKLNSKQDSIARGTGFLKRTGLVWSYDPSTYLTTETDPIFNSSVAKTINATDTVKWSAKQNQINGTGFVKASGTALSYDNSSYYPSSNPNGYTSNVGTVTSVSGFTLGTTGTDISTSVQNNTTTPLLGINIPTASATNRGALSSADWSIFNNKQPAGSYLTGITSSQVTTALGYTPLSNATSFRTVNSVSVVGSGDISINPFPGFGTGNGAAWGYNAHPTTISGYGITDIPSYGTSSLTTNYLPKWNGGNFVNSLLRDNGTNIGNVSPLYKFHLRTNTDGNIGFRNPVEFNTSWATGSVIGCFNDADNANMPLYIESSSLGLNRTSGAEIISGGQFTAKQINSVGSSNWYGAAISGNNASDKVVIGGLASLATIGAHNSALNAWANLSINQGGGNVSIGYSADQGYKFAVNGNGMFAGTVTASSFYGSASNLTNLPINLTTTGTSGAATYTQSTNTLNVPNYTNSTSAGGTYTPTFTNNSGVTSISGNYAGLYTSVGGIKTFTFGFHCTLANGSGVLDVTLPIPATNLSVNYTTVGNATVASSSAVNSAYAISSDHVTINLYSSSTSSQGWFVTVTYQ